MVWCGMTRAREGYRRCGRAAGKEGFRDDRLELHRRPRRRLSGHDRAHDVARGGVRGKLACSLVREKDWGGGQGRGGGMRMCCCGRPFA